MSKKQKMEITEDTIIGAGVDEEQKEVVDAETARVDNDQEITAANPQAASPIPAGLNPGSGGEYRLEDGQIIPVMKGE
jgi:hypothetical protein